MVASKIFFNNFLLKKYFIKKVFLKDIYKKKIKTYLHKQKYIKFENIKNNFLMLYNRDYPVGYILQNKNNTVGFLGTLFSMRKIGSKNFLFCNIHSWLVDTKHRIASQLLFKEILNKSVITVLTARPGLTNTFLKMGFKSLQMKYRIQCLINFSFFTRNKKNTSIVSKKSLVLKKIKNQNIRIYNDHSGEKFIKFIVFDKNKESDYSFVVGRIVTKRKYFKVLNIVYVDNEFFFKKNWLSIQKNILSKFKVFFCGQYFLKNKNSLIPKINIFSKDIQREIFTRNLPKSYKFNILYSEFDL